MRSNLGRRQRGVPRTLEVARRNAGQRGLVHFFVSLEAAAGDPEHPAHEFFVDHDQAIVHGLVHDIRERQEAGTFDPAVDPELMARIFSALSDGLQAQWMINPAIDFPGTMEGLWNLFSTVVAPDETPSAEPEASH